MVYDRVHLAWPLTLFDYTIMLRFRKTACTYYLINLMIKNGTTKVQGFFT